MVVRSKSSLMHTNGYDALGKSTVCVHVFGARLLTVSSDLGGCFVVVLFFVFCLFFFSSRRRHTRCSRDWSSDVCSSDLAFTSETRLPRCFLISIHFSKHQKRLNAQNGCGYRVSHFKCVPSFNFTPSTSGPGRSRSNDCVQREIGRASCRERV